MDYGSVTRRKIIFQYLANTYKSPNWQKFANSCHPDLMQWRLCRQSRFYSIGRLPSTPPPSSVCRCRAHTRIHVQAETTRRSYRHERATPRSSMHSDFGNSIHFQCLTIVFFEQRSFQNEELYFGRSGYFYCTANFQSVLIHWKLLNQTSFNRNFNCAIKWKTQYRLLQVSFTYHSSYVPTYLGTSKVSICMYVCNVSVYVCAMRTYYVHICDRVYTKDLFLISRKNVKLNYKIPSTLRNPTLLR